MNNFWNTLFWGHTLREWTLAAGLLTAFLLALKSLRPIVLRRLQRWSLQTKTTLDDLLVVLLERSVFPLLYVGSVYAALAYLQPPVPLARGARYVIGRALECELYVRDSSVSRQHAELIAERGQVKVRDLASLNGTFLDDQRVAECLATPGQVLRFGRVTFLLSDDPHRTRWPRSSNRPSSSPRSSSATARCTRTSSMPSARCGRRCG